MKVLLLRRAACSVIILFAVTMMVAGCATYRGAKGTWVLRYEGTRKDAHFGSYAAAERAARELSKEIASFKSNDKDIVIRNVNFVPVEEKDIFMVSNGWTLRLKVEYEIRQGARLGKRRVKVECFDKAGRRISKAEFCLNIRKSKAEADLLNGFGFAVAGLFGFGTGVNCLRNRELKQNYPELGFFGPILILGAC